MEISLEWSDVYRGKLNEAKVNLKRFQQPGIADDANMANPSFSVFLFIDANFQASQVSGNFPLGKKIVLFTKRSEVLLVFLVSSYSITELLRANVLIVSFLMSCLYVCSIIGVVSSIYAQISNIHSLAHNISTIAHHLKSLGNSGSKNSNSEEDEKRRAKTNGGLHSQGQFLSIGLGCLSGLENSLSAFLNRLVDSLNLHIRVVLRDSLRADSMIPMVKVLEVSFAKSLNNCEKKDETHKSHPSFHCNVIINRI